ncbi:MAG: sulfatase-like hydrolase/transferase [Armatimonadota bacterium]|nr:MAG: sulfatase-like hydrolase/transferase [Armatimonadota bacterium]
MWRLIRVRWTRYEDKSIHSIAVNGIRFTQFCANAPVCSPSRAALMAARYSDPVGVPGVIRTDRENSWGETDPKAVALPRSYAVRKKLT